MIMRESCIIDEIEYDKTYSNLSVYIANEKGFNYALALDRKGLNRKYVETDIPIPYETLSSINF